MNKLTYITSAETINTGGGCMVDVFQLDDGRAILINDECLTIYTSLNDFMEYGGERGLLASMSIPQPAKNEVPKS